MKQIEIYEYIILGKITHILTPHYSDSSDYALAQRYKMMRIAPPPYPANRLSSTSTPDLALASHRGLVSLVGFRAAQVSGSRFVLQK